jgi:hypothetical protein
MKTEVFITRSCGKPLTLNEWIQYIKTRKDIEMPYVISLSGIKNGKLYVGRPFNPGYAQWILKEKGGSKKVCHLKFKKDSVIIKNPNCVEIIELKEMAKCLNADLIGDEGEKY